MPHRRSAKTKDMKQATREERRSAQRSEISLIPSHDGNETLFKCSVVNTGIPETRTERSVFIAAGATKRKRTPAHKSVSNLFKRGPAQRQTVSKLNTIGEDANRALAVRSSELAHVASSTSNVTCAVKELKLP